MPSTISAGTTAGTAIAIAGDTTGNLAFQTNGTTTAMTITTGQNVGIGTSAPGGKLDVIGTSLFRGTVGGRTLKIAEGGVTTIGFDIEADTNAGDLTLSSANSGGLIAFKTAGSERMRINNSGVGINSAPAAYIGNEQFFVNGTNTAGQHTATITQAASSPSGGCNLFLVYNNSAPNNTSNSYLICNDNTGVQKLNIYSNGTVSNRTGTYNSLSDLKLKENIVDATPKLDKLMQTKVRNYNLIGDELKQIGFVAQELEQVFPGLVEDVPDFDENQQPTGEVTKMVKTSVLIPILVKAMQEQQAMIEAIKAELDATKAEVAALKQGA